MEFVSAEDSRQSRSRKSWNLKCFLGDLRVVWLLNCSLDLSTVINSMNIPITDDFQTKINLELPNLVWN